MNEPNITTYMSTAEMERLIAEQNEYLSDILATLGQIEGIVWFFGIVLLAVALYKFIRVFI